MDRVFDFDFVFEDILLRVDKKTKTLCVCFFCFFGFWLVVPRAQELGVVHVVVHALKPLIGLLGLLGLLLQDLLLGDGAQIGKGEFACNAVKDLSQRLYRSRLLRLLLPQAHVEVDDVVALGVVRPGAVINSPLLRIQIRKARRHGNVNLINLDLDVFYAHEFGQSGLDGRSRLDKPDIVVHDNEELLSIRVVPHSDNDAGNCRNVRHVLEPHHHLCRQGRSRGQDGIGHSWKKEEEGRRKKEEDRGLCLGL